MGNVFSTISTFLLMGKKNETHPRIYHRNGLHFPLSLYFLDKTIRIAR